MNTFDKKHYIGVCDELEFNLQSDFIDHYSELCDKIISKYNVCLLDFHKIDSVNTMLNVTFNINNFNYDRPTVKNSLYSVSLLIDNSIYVNTSMKEDYINILCRRVDDALFEIFKLFIKPQYIKILN